jgi:hypothetical protein
MRAAAGWSTIGVSEKRDRQDRPLRGGSADEVLNSDRPDCLIQCEARGSRVNERGLQAADRVIRLLRQLGIERAHVVQGVAETTAHPATVASLALVTPAASASSPLRQLAGSRRLVTPPLIIHSDAGPLSAQAAFVLAADPGATAVVLRGYVSAHWTDTVADRAEEIAAALLTHLAEAQRRTPLPKLRLVGEGEIAGINYQARGSGPPLIFFPLHLAPSQWEPILPALAEHYCTITLGGPHLGFASILEQRAEGGYGAAVDDLIDALQLAPGGVGGRCRMRHRGFHPPASPPRGSDGTSRRSRHQRLPAA